MRAQNLNTILENSVDDVIVAGSILHNIETVDKGAIAALRISTAIKPRFLGIGGLKNFYEDIFEINHRKIRTNNIFDWVISLLFFMDRPDKLS